MLDDKAKEISDAVVKRLVAYRLKRGISQTKLAKIAGLSRAGIRHMESGETHPTLYTLAKVSSALEVSLGRLITEESLRLRGTREDRRSPGNPL